MLDLLTAVLLWLLVLVNPTMHEQAAPLTDCTFYEDGAMICDDFTLPAYDLVIGD